MNPYHDSTHTNDLLNSIERGSQESLVHLVSSQRDYLRRIVELRMEPELRSRVDPSDIVQETQLVVLKRIDDFLERRPSSFRIWLRAEAIEQIIGQRRRHLDAQKRSVRRECALSEASSLSLAKSVMLASPSEVAQRREFATQIRDVIASLGETDRGVLLLRLVEQLTNSEVAELLQVEPAAARKRYGRALRRLHEKLSSSGMSDLLSPK